MTMLSKFNSALIWIFLICVSCNQEQDEIDFEVESEIEDSMKVYSFFHDKINPTWDYTSSENDSVIYEFDEFGLPKRRSEAKNVGATLVNFSIEYIYNIDDSTETVKHLQQFGGGHSLTEIRKFDAQGNVLWKEEIDVYHNRMRTEYDQNGIIKQIIAL